MLVKRYNQLQNLKSAIGGVKVGRANWGGLKLISIHIPKSAGTSFFHTLRKEYGPRKVVRIDTEGRAVRVNKVPLNAAYISRNPTVVHGHFIIDDLEDIIKSTSGIPVITWLREPAERVISNYFYLSKRLEEELGEKKKGLNILSKMKRSLLEYAHGEANRNRISKFLRGVELQDLSFIGLVSEYDKDVSDLAQKLEWKTVQTFTHNKTNSSLVEKVDSETMKIIKSLNQEDYEVFEKAMELRKQGINS